MNAQLEINNLSLKIDQKPIVSDLSFTIAAGKCLALVGESGSGKTLTALAVAQLLPRAVRVTKQSEIILEKKDLLSLSEKEMCQIRGRKIGMIFQEPMTALNPVLTVGAQISEALHHFHLSRRERYARVIDLLTAVGIQDPVHCYQQYPHQLSGGMRQRVVVAIAVAGEPALIIADEPTSALDVTVQAQVLKLIKTLQIEKQIAMLFISHDLAVVKQVADDVAVMQAGQLVEYKSAKVFFKKPEHDYSRQLFAALPQFLDHANAVSVQSPVLETVKDLQVYWPIQKGVFKKTVGYVKAVDGVSFELHQGKTLALIGESGSGKTTIGKTLVGLITPTGGSISSESRVLSSSKDVQMVFQDPFSSLNPRMRIVDIITEGVRGVEDNRAEIAAKLLTQVGLSHEGLYRYPHEFSGGQRQRISIARALAVNPKLIICDEPTSALDVSVQAQILKLLRTLQDTLGMSYLFITHNIHVVGYMADTVAVIHQGKIVEYGDVKKVLSSPQHPYTKMLLDAMPLI